MRYTTYSRYLPGLLETLNLQALLDQLADFLLQSGFAEARTRIRSGASSARKIPIAHSTRCARRFSRR